MKVRRVTNEEIMRFADLLIDMSNLSNELDNSEIDWEDFPSLKILKGANLDSHALSVVLQKIKNSPFELIIFNLQVLLDNCADLEDDTLEFNPEIRKARKGLELLKEIDEYLSPNPLNHIYCNSILHEKIKTLLS